MDSSLRELTNDGSLVWSVTAALSLGVLFLYYQYYKNKYSFWKRRKINGPRAWPLVGNIFQLFGNNRRSTTLKWREHYGKVYGLYQGSQPILMVSDPELARDICIKHLDVFPNHASDFPVSKIQESFIFMARDERWRYLRARLSSTFTSGKMRRMHKRMEFCATDLLEAFGDHFEQAACNGQAGPLVNLKEVFHLYTMDSITSCCYGLKLEREKSVVDLKTVASRNEFVRMALKMFTFSPWRLAIIFSVSKRLLELVDFKLTPDSQMEPFAKRVQQLIDRRRRETGRQFDDYLQIVLESSAASSEPPDRMDSLEQHHAGNLNEATACKSHDQEFEKEDERKLDDMAILSNATMLLAVALETTATLLTHCAYALAYHKHVQDKLYEEVGKIAIWNDSTLNFHYDSLISCHYLDSVLSETLRMLSPAFQTDRISRQDYHIQKHKLTLPANTRVIIDIGGIMMDPQYWPEPDKFDPLRFMPENRHKIVSGTYIPFGLGPRHCLGMRFALTEAKLGLAKLVMRFRFSPAPGKEFPPEFNLAGIKEATVRLERRT